MKAYGTLDGLVVGCALAFALLALAALLQSSDWRWFVVAVILVMSAIAVSARLGRGLVDGVFLRPSFRWALLTLVAFEISGLTTYLLWPVRSIDGNGKTKTETDTLKRNLCDELKKDVDDLNDKIGSGQTETALGLWARAMEREREHNCEQNVALTALLPRLKANAAAVPSERADFVQRVEAVATALNEVPKPPPERENEAQKRGTVAPNTPTEPDWASLAPAPLLPRSDDKGKPIPIVKLRSNDNKNWLLSVFGAVLGIGFGSVKITVDEVKGLEVTTKDGRGKSLKAMEEALAGQPWKVRELKARLRRYLNDDQQIKDPREAEAIRTYLNSDAETVLCQYVLSKLPKADDADLLKTMDPGDEAVSSALMRIKLNDREATFQKVKQCVYQLDSRNFEHYGSILASLEQEYQKLRGQ